MFSAAAAAQFLDEAHRTRARYVNLPEPIAPKSFAEAYAAQEALIALSSSKALDADLRDRALAALARTSRPTEHAVATFRAILDDTPFDMRALYALGIYSRRLRDQGDVDRANAIGTVLAERLRAACGSSASTLPRLSSV